MIFNNPKFLPEFDEQAELIEKLLDIGTALSGTEDLSSLLNLILAKSREITSSDAGSVYLLDHSDNNSKLLFKIAQNASLPNLSFKEFAIPLTPRSLAGYVALNSVSLNIPDAYDLPIHEPYQLDRSFDENISYRTRSVLVVPMQNRKGEVIGVLQLINRKVNPDIKITPENAIEATKSYSKWEERVLRSLASQAAISIERNHLQESIENLFEGFVKASVEVIEARGPCTCGHSERVAELAVRLSQEVSQTNFGSLSEITFSERQLQELRYAALLHDFGKVGVPEAILTKPKKLYPPQLEVIRHRFALAQRTLEAESIQRKYEHLLQHSAQKLPQEEECIFCQSLQESDQKLSQSVTKLSKYWTILLEANEPKVLAEIPLNQLREVAQITYRDLDGEMKPLLTPEEIDQLLIHQGTLTPEERERIESHVSYTYAFLKQIPWTNDLKNVPMIAYRHHEKLNGTGYPLGLTSADIPIQAQIITIADIYDALTAGDRPYKSGLPTVTALKILQQEASKNTINADCLELFKQRKVYEVLGHSIDVVMELA
ncbi:3'3'-cGAMP-specific phosphodiesterase 3 [Planktothrix rubescens]|jgi:HD-GYP domain-containing protein (c-di-GMP phosphodiesterase class II)|nr:3'3'-cGAMP-specific phosphodiesterase 3 [Planktothrix rubescens]